MLDNWLIISIALGYLLLLFVIAEFGERYLDSSRPRPWIYSLSLAVYCTSWAMFGTVAQSSATGWFLAPTYLGSILFFIFGWPVLIKIIRIAKQNKVTSIADFIASRFGRSHFLGGLVVTICLFAIVPYISLQLKAIVNSYTLLSSGGGLNSNATPISFFQDTAFYVAVILGIFTLLFGTRKVDATEHHQGIMLAIAFESIIKLCAFLVVGFFTVYWVFDGFSDLWQQAHENPVTRNILEARQPSFIYLSQAFLGMIAIVCLPRQFHVLVVENRSEKDLMKSRWIFPSYLLLINLFILPIAIAGNLIFQDGSVSAEDFILMLPASGESPFISLLAFIGGISAATSMIIVSTIVLSTMIGNEIIVPFAVKFFSFKLSEKQDLGKRLIGIRRVLILAILILAYVYYQNIAVSALLATTGLLSFALIAQLAPALFAGVYWKRCTQKATVAGLLAGLLLWSYTLLVPSLAEAGILSNDLVEYGPWGIELLKPTQLFGLYGFDSLTHGLFWSLSTNLLLVIYLSLKSEQTLLEKLQSSQFLSTNPNLHNEINSQTFELNIPDLVLLAERFIGKKSAQQAFAKFCTQHNIPRIQDANKKQLTRATEQLLQGIIGATSTRLIFESLASDQPVPFEDVASIIDEAADVLLFNRELLQSAIENISHGISVVDKDLRLVAWNAQYVELFEYPDELVKVGRPIEELCRFNANQGILGEGNIEELVNKRLEFMRTGSPHVFERQRDNGLVLEMRGNPMPGGGFVTSFIDITEFRSQQNELKQINLELEQRVSVRTEELQQLNQSLLEAKSMAELANHSKTRFLAAASHDVLQPLNAASLFSATLHEQVDTEQQKNLALRIQQALHSAEQLLKDLIEISKLDSGNIAPTYSNFSVADLMRQLTQEFAVMAEEKKIELRTVYCNKSTHSDRTMLRRILQNLLGNAIKHSNSKKILFGCRRVGNELDIHIIDQGKGIETDQQQRIFNEFVQLDSDKIAVEGHGLGLAIVSRILQVLKIPLDLKSSVGKGCDFFIRIPTVSQQSNSPSKETEVSTSFSSKYTANNDQLILCVDNEQSILDGMQALLNAWGFHNLMLSLDGDFSANKQFKVENVALILADYHLLNNKTGIDVITHIRQQAKWEIPSVIISADQSDQLKKEIQQNSLFLLAKPIKPLSLRTLLNRLMHG